MLIAWEEPVVSGAAPCARSGHTLTACGGKFYLFGGTGRCDGKAQSFSDLYELDTSNPDDYKWRQISTPAGKSSPPARARHCAIAVDGKHLLVFGGLDKRTRYNDAWLFNADSREWAQLSLEGACPEPRAHFTATCVGDRLLVFGGYGGCGAVFSDLWALDLGSVGGSASPLRWQDLTPQLQGTGPSPRFDHTACAFPVTTNSLACERLVVSGGRDLSAMLHDSHTLDLGTLTWLPGGAPPLPSEVCNNVCEGVPSVPHHKVFSFGGKRGMMSYVNAVEVLDCGSQAWSTPVVVDAAKAPCGREDTVWAYDVKTSSFLVFGGWASRWLGDLVRLDVSAIIGPPYACTGISPAAGPVFGGSTMIIKGMLFQPGRAQVRFGNSEKNFVIVEGEVLDSETIRCQTANYQQFGAMPVDVRVDINGAGWTVNKMSFTYFANTAARNCLAFGPGLLPSVVSGVQLSFLVQALDTLNERRVSGGDRFVVRVVSLDGRVEGDTAVTDRCDGTYEVQYAVPLPGPYLLHVSYADLGGSEALPVRGSPFSVDAADPWTRHRVLGAVPAAGTGASLSALDGDLVLFGDSTTPAAGVSVCTMSAGDWRWAGIMPAGTAPVGRRFHSATLLPGSSQLTFFGGSSSSSSSAGAEASELADMFWLTKAPDGSFEWGWPRSQAGVAVAARSSHAAVAVDQQLLLLGGQSNGALLGELSMAEAAAGLQVVRWAEPLLSGDTPMPRKGAAAAATAGTIVLFGGTASDAEGQPVVLDELVLFSCPPSGSSGGSMSCRIAPSDVSGLRPCARTGATLLECSPGQLLLYGGCDANGRPLDDAFVFSVHTLAWHKVYCGHPDLVGQHGALAALLDGKLVLLHAGPGSTKLDTARSLDVFGLTSSFKFGDKMRVEAVALLERLEAWVDKTASSLELGHSTDRLAASFDGLLKVLDSLYQVKVRKASNDLLVQQLRETFRVLAADKLPVAKLDKRLDEAARKWEEVKKQAPLVKAAVKPVQATQAERIRRDIDAFAARTAAHRAAFRSHSLYKYATSCASAYPLLDAAAAELAKLRKECTHFAELAAVFELADAITPDAIAEAFDDLAALKDVWDCRAMCEVQFTAWRQTLWQDVNTEEMEEGAKSFVKEVKSLHKKVRDEDVFKGLDGMVKNFLVSMPLVADLRSPAMRPRHWQLLMEATRVSFSIDATFKLDDLLALQLHKYEDEVGEIVDRAQKEEKMEAGLRKLDEAWARVAFQFTKHKDTSVFTVKMAEEDFEMLEDNQVLVQGMMANRYMDTFREPILAWNKKLMAVADVVSAAAEIQRTWAYLESLFIASEEVKKELPDASQRFVRVDKDVKAILAGFRETPNCVDACSKDGLLKFLEKQHAELEVCEKALADFMEAKKRMFSRFYFVSTADLLDILSNGNSPVKVMEHMSKCFQAIGKLKLDSKAPAGGARPKALGMVSCIGEETVAFKTPLPLEGKVECYMTDIVSKVRGELRDVLRDAVVDYTRQPRDKWLFAWPSQIILVVNQVFWCQEVEEAFRSMSKGESQAMARYNEQQVKQLTRLIEVTRTDLPKAERMKVMNMITIDAHSRDIVANMAREGTADADAFLWMCQLRSYWDASIADCRIRICDATFGYGYEYLGNGPRLVITPLTDRIYITATQACWMCMGTAPAGPAGTGKTETTKDLSAQLGKSCYVFNCSPEMDYRTMGDIFKGLAASGSWGCFDEFNRLVPEVLSVCSVQYKCVTDAQKRKSLLPGRGLEYIDRAGTKHPEVAAWSFVAADGVEMPLEEGTSCFITMNPGYIGRAELPESLKALFRPITVVVPDRQLIMENMLMAEGFVEAKILAKKFASLYYLLEDLLSPQKHYDWGLRAIKSVLVVAGSLLRAEEGQLEANVLFRALRDLNIAKILDQDMVVFMGLLNDLLPGLDPPRKRDLQFERVIADTTADMKLTRDDDFLLRVVQLSELLAIRHCVFLMGPTGSARTEVYKVLAQAITCGCDAPVNDYLKATNRKKVVIRDINPKAVSASDLYGFVNMATREWKDGLLSYTMRELANMPDDNPKWILLDGDLDANWVESMNSVMDDSRLLTLPSNERIRLLPHMKMIFEIRDLKYATPATATRAGILYISEGRQWHNMVQSWLQRVARPYADKAKWKDASVPAKWLSDLFDKYLPPTILEMKRSFSHITPLSTMNFVTTLVNILEGVLKPESISSKADQPLFEMHFVFATIWAFGGALVDKDGIPYRRTFDRWWKQTWTTIKLPGKGTVYDYFVNSKTGKFQPWAEVVQDVSYASGGSQAMASMFVPTAETSSLRFFLDMMVDLHKPIMFVGGAGVGKTQLVKGKLASLPEEMISLSMSFNYFTDVVSFQKVLEAPLEKKAGINYGPPGTKHLVYFVDDLNMPKLDAYETAMPISLIRQHLSWGHWFDRHKLTPKNINNTQYVACMNPTAGSFVINPRLQRLFMTLAVDFPGQDSLMKIYGTFLQGHLKHFKEDVQELGTKILQAALALHERVSSTFRKTAVNFHYEFTVRHLANVFQGLLMSAPDVVNTPAKWGKLWLHESERVYADRLVSSLDLEAYSKAACAVAKKYFAIPDVDEFFRKKDPRPLMFCHFARSVSDKTYDEVSSFQHLYKVLTEALLEYNETHAVMDLVLFEDAMKHVARISRIISSPGGHALLVGVGGSGKQSLARLAAYICDYSTVTIVISGSYTLSSFREDLQKMYKRAGLKGEGLMFLLTDSQIVDERMLVSINDLLASGEIPDLFAQEEREEIINGMRGETKSLGLQDTPDNCWATFIGKVRANLHVAFTASPVGEAFRVRSQRFLATINSTVIDWFQPWPEVSLLSVAHKFLDDTDLVSDAVRAAVVEFMPFSFAAVNKACKAFYEAERRHVYTTPKTFLELIKLYKSTLARKRKESQEAIDRLENGLNKLHKTQSEVDVLVENVRAMALDVEQKVASANVFAEQVGAEKEKVNAENESAKVEADKCAAIAREVSEKQAACEADLAAAEPLVQQAEAALDTLNKKDLGETKSLKKPPPGVDDITAVVIILLEGNPKDKSWAAAQKAMNNVDKFLERMRGFKAVIDQGQVTKKTVEACRSYLELPHFNKEVIFTKSRAAAGLCEWAINIVKYYDVVSEVEPKRQELAAANAKLHEANSTLAAVQQKVAELNAKVQELEAQFGAAVEEKEAAIRESERCQLKLQLANRLINALASEGERWAATVDSLRANYDVLTGDMLLAAAFISYSGAFTSRFRAGLIRDWIKFLTDKGAPMTAGVTDPLSLLVDSAMMAGWVRQGLPSDPTSMQNGMLLCGSERWPLMMDPQLQGVVWIKERESKNNLQVARMGADNLITIMERAMEAGQSVLIENMGESIDAVLSPVITRSTFKKGRLIYIKLGDKDVEYNRNFRLFLHTKLSKPHYPPEVQAETTLITFAVTEAGLEDQLLALVVNKERPDLEETKTQLIIQSTEFTIKLKQLEDELLFKLSTAEGDITEDVPLIESLEASKRLATEIGEKVVEASDTEAAINDSRNKYRPVAERGAMLFFLLNSLNKIHAFYQYSLGAFVEVFARGLDTAPGGHKQPQQRGEHVTLRQLQKRVSGNAQDFEEVIQRAKRQSSSTGAVPPSRQTSSKRTSNHGGSTVATVPTTPAGPHTPGNARGTVTARTTIEEEGRGGAAPLTPEELEARIVSLLDTCTYTVFNYTRRGLFDRDKLIVLTLLTFQILLRSGAIDAAECEALSKGARRAAPAPITDDLSRWLSESQWAAVDALTSVPGFAHLAKDMEKNSEEWATWCASESQEHVPLPGDWDRLPEFKQLLLLRALRPDQVAVALQRFCKRVMGERYVNQPAFSPQAVLEESTSATPIFFILFPGYSPSKDIEEYARRLGRSTERGDLHLISMGQGQEGPAEAVLDRCMAAGGWVFLDNLHLMQGWIPRLERKLEAAAESAHPGFRCFFSAEPINGAPQANIVPESILQMCIKVSNEPPSDMKSNMRRAFAAFSPEAEGRLSSAAKRTAYRSILFGLCFYHSLLLGRKKFGTGIGTGSGSGLGFCRGYSFNTGDLLTCGDVLLNYLEAYEAIPWDDLRYMFGEIFYGGHITDGMDRRCCITYLQELIRPQLLPGGALDDAASWQPPTLQLAPGFTAPLPASCQALAEYIEAALPAESPLMYGMHPNAGVLLSTSLGETLFKTVAEVSGGATGVAAGGAGGEGAVRAALADYLARLPELFAMLDIEARAQERTPYVIVALQEATRMNALLVELRRSMEELQLGLDGALNMSDKMEALARGIATNTVPALWMSVMSTRVQEVYSLAAWYADVLRRYEQLAAWTSGPLATPHSVWLAGLFNPKAFLTAVIQTYTRAHKLPLDVMSFVTEVTNKSVEQVTEPAPLGCYIHGCVLEGARWDREEGVLKESAPNELRQALPVLQVKPVAATSAAGAAAPAKEQAGGGDGAAAAPQFYECPVYTNSQRANVYSPAVSTFTLRTAEPPRKWVLASVAILLQDELSV